MPRDIDPENITADDVEYIGARHGIQKELEFQSGVTFQQLKEAVDRDGVVSLMDLVATDEDESDEEPVEPEPSGSAEPEPESEPDEDEDEEPEDYSGYDHSALKAEIDLRNEDRDEPISKGGSADDLRERLMADDEALASEEDEDEQ